MQVKSAAVIFMAIFFSACGSAKFHVNVSSLVAEGRGGGKTYVLLPGNADTSAEDLSFKEFSLYASGALSSQGYVPAPNAEEADLAVFLAYGVGNPMDQKYAYSFPVPDTAGRPAGIETNKPGRSVKGYEEYCGRYRTYFKFIYLDAYDLRRSRRTGETVELWETSITSGGSGADLRAAFPVLVAAARSYIGVDTGRTIEFILDQEDPGVLDLKERKYSPPAVNWRKSLREKLDRERAN